MTWEGGRPSGTAEVLQLVVVHSFMQSDDSEYEDIELYKVDYDYHKRTPVSNA